MPADLSQTAIEEALAGSEFGRHVTYLDSCGSTNDVARALAEEGAPHGSLVVADHQTAGRGRLGRRWQAPAGSSLLLSMLFRLALPPDRLQQLTMLGGLAVVDACLAVTCLHVGLKWPNDLLLHGSKIGGILAELGLRGRTVDYAVIGIGLNVNLDPGSVAEPLLMPITSLGHELGEHVERLALLQAIVSHIERRSSELEGGADLSSEWGRRLETVGQSVRVTTADRTVTGVAEGVTSLGGLCVRCADGELVTILAGDVTRSGTWARPDERSTRA